MDLNKVYDIENDVGEAIMHIPVKYGMILSRLTYLQF